MNNKFETFGGSEGAKEAPEPKRQKELETKRIMSLGKKILSKFKRNSYNTDNTADSDPHTTDSDPQIQQGTSTSPEDQKEIVLDEILQETIDSFNEKYQAYQDKYADLDRRYYDADASDHLDINGASRERKKLAKRVIRSLDEKELSYFRRQFIRRSYLYNGDESYVNGGGKIKNGHSSQYWVFAELHDADKNFHESKEWEIYNRKECNGEYDQIQTFMESITGGDFERQINEIMAMSRSIEEKGRVEATKLARELLSNKSYNKYAVAGAIGPSVIMDIIEEDPNAVGDFDMGAFVSKISNPDLDKDVPWALNCRMLIATELERYTAPKLGVDVDKFINSERTITKLSTLDHILKVRPDFNVEEFLAMACEDEPAIMCANAEEFLKRGFNFPIIEIEQKLKVEAERLVKNESEDEWKKYHFDNFEDDIQGLVEDYKQYGRLSDSDEEKITDELDQFHWKIFKESRDSRKEIVLDEILQETIDSFNEKYQAYQDEYADLDRRYYDADASDHLDVYGYRRECEKLAERAIGGLDEKELSYFRRQFIRRSYLYNGDESYVNDGGEIKNGHSSQYWVFAKLHEADKNFRKSKEWEIYSRKKRNDKNDQLKSEFEAMSEEELKELRRQRFEWEVNDIDPVPYRDEDGKIIDEKYEQNERIRELWKLDKGWEDSEEGRQATDKKHEKWADEAAQEWAELLVKYPDIFKEPDQSEIDRLIEEAVGKIPRDRISKIAALKTSGKYRQSDQAMIDLFVDVFSLEYRPIIEYSNKNTTCSGSYTHRLKRVEVRRKFGGRDNEKAIINTIAHEMWHAHQHDETDHDTERGQKYKTNTEHYQPGHPRWDLINSDLSDSNKWDEAYKRYKNQLIEAEAFAFGKAFADYYYGIISAKKNAS